MGFIPEDVITQVLDRSDIVSVISSYVPVKHAGRNFKALCPFHHEKTPSFIINPEKQIFHCFGCGVGGNVISFVMQQERLEFPEAVRLLAEKAGITIPEKTERDSKAPQLRQQLKKVNNLAVEYFRYNLLTDKGTLAKTAREYLQSRGLTLEVVKNFKLGLALEPWDGLLQHLRKKEIPLGLLERAGLVIAQNKSDGYYDRFRKRIMFPIFDSKGDCVAFGGRAMPGEDKEAKYLNSPETLVYTKGDHLYGFNWAKETIGRLDEAIVVEGYLDFITPFHAGVTNVVASLGTALTVEQIRLIRRYTHNIVMLYDADPAGQSAMLRSLDTLVEEGMTVKVAALSEGDDPDSFVRKNGAGRFQEQIKSAVSLFDFKLKFLLKAHGEKTIEARAKISTEMLGTISRFPNAIVQSEYIKRLAQTLFLSPDVLNLELKRLATKDSSLQSEVSEKRPGLKPGDRIRRPVEENLVRLMLSFPEFVAPARAQIQATDFRDEVLRQVVGRVFELFDRNGQVSVAEVMGGFSQQEILNTISALLSVEDALLADKTKIFQDCLARLEQERQRSRRWILRQAMDEAKNAGDHNRLNDLLQEFNQLIKVKGIS